MIIWFKDRSGFWWRSTAADGSYDWVKYASSPELSGFEIETPASKSRCFLHMLTNRCLARLTENQTWLPLKKLNLKLRWGKGMCSTQLLLKTVSHGGKYIKLCGNAMLVSLTPTINRLEIQRRRAWNIFFYRGSLVKKRTYRLADIVTVHEGILLLLVKGIVDEWHNKHYDLDNVHSLYAEHTLSEIIRAIIILFQRKY